MDANTLNVILFVVQIIFAGGAWLLRSMFNDVKEQAKLTQKELADYKVQVAKEYASREEVDRLIASFNKSIEQHTIFVNERFNRLEQIIEKVRDRE